MSSTETATASASSTCESSGFSPEKDWRRNTIALAIGAFCTALGFTAPFPYLPFIIREFGVEANLETWVGVAVGGFFGVTFLLTPIWGAFADHYGKRSMVLRAGWGMALGFTSLALAPNLYWFIPLYLLTGAFTGFMPAAQALVASNTPRAYTGRALAALQTGTLLGTTLGPAVGALLIGWLPGYRTLFWVNGPITFIAALMTHLFVRERHVRSTKPFRIHLLSDLREMAPKPRMTLLWFVAFSFAVTYFGSAAVVSLYTLQLMPVAEGSWLHFEVEGWVAIVSLALTVTSAASLPFWGRLLDRYDPYLLMFVGLGLTAAVTFMFPFVANPLHLALARLLLGLVGAGIRPASVTLTKDAAPEGMEARAMAIGTAANMLGNGMSPFVAGLIGPWLGLRAYFLLNGGLMVIALVWWSLRGLARSPKASAG